MQRYYERRREAMSSWWDTAFQSKARGQLLDQACAPSTSVANLSRLDLEMLQPLTERARDQRAAAARQEPLAENGSSTPVTRVGR
jgi:hypothetical protein